MSSIIPSLAVVVPAAGVGKRMQANCPKQYLTIQDKTVLEHTVERLLAHPKVSLVVIALGKDDGYFSQTSLIHNPKVKTVHGGAERVDSVLAGLKAIEAKDFPWVMVHDAARPCVRLEDITALITNCEANNVGGLLASPVRDTMKQSSNHQVEKTIDRSELWHAYTPQMYPHEQLTSAIDYGLNHQVTITDESSAIEAINQPSMLVEGASDNIKITRAEDLALARFILQQQQEQKT